MKSLTSIAILLLLTLAIIKESVAQSSKLELSIEYSPNFSKLNDILRHELQLSHNAVFRLAFDTERKIKPNIGLGYFHISSLREHGILSAVEFDSRKYIENYSYLFIPVGLQIRLSKIFVLPEIGVGLYLSNSTNTITTYSNGDVNQQKSTLSKDNLNAITLPLSLTAGHDIQLQSFSFALGVKAYYGLNRVAKLRPNNYYGVGMFIAVNL